MTLSPLRSRLALFVVDSGSQDFARALEAVFRSLANISTSIRGSDDLSGFASADYVLWLADAPIAVELAAHALLVDMRLLPAHARRESEYWVEQRGESACDRWLFSAAGSAWPTADPDSLAACLLGEWARLSLLVPPLKRTAVPTTDSLSYRRHDLSKVTELPLLPHPGAFGAVRRHHVHEGVDLYGSPGDEVVSLESGRVVAIRPFTGQAISSPWWADTWCVLVEGASGVFNYGELRPLAGLTIGAPLRAGEVLGHLVTVLRQDKGRPCTMLHLERYARGTREPVLEWPRGTPKPSELLNPTPLLAGIARL